MDFVFYLQSFATSILTTFATIFEFLGRTPFFVLLFAFTFLLYDKKFAYKYFLTYSSGFIVGSLFLKNVVQRKRPYDIDESLMSVRSSYSYSLPSATSILATENAFFYYKTRQNSVTKARKIILIALLSCCVLLSGLTQIYFANNFLIDVIIGFIVGFIISLIIFKFVEVSDNLIKYLFLIGFPALIIFLLCFARQFFTSNFDNGAIFEFIGIGSSILLGYFLENKYIKYQVKNNFIFTCFKVFSTLIILIGYYYFCKLVLPGKVIFSFIKYFVAGLVVTMLLPFLFKKAQNYFYVFSPKVNLNDVEKSYISFSLKDTKKIAKNILKDLKKGEVILLSGDLGAGKSVLVRNILIEAGVSKAITSPTFTLVNEYNLPNWHFYHFDMYRIDDENEVSNLGFDEIIDDKDSIKFIEWPEKIEGCLPKKFKKITIVKLGNKSRNIIVEKN